MIPIVLGAKKEEYNRMLPKHSFIHVDDFESPKHLAEYLNILDKNDTLYNEYFKWKSVVEKTSNGNTWCRMCSLLNHENVPRMWYTNIDDYWRKNKCIGDHSWINNTYYDNTHVGGENYQSLANE